MLLEPPVFKWESGSEGDYRFCAHRLSDGSQTWCSADETAGRDPNQTDYMLMGTAFYAAAVTGASPASRSLVVESLDASTGNRLWTTPLSGTSSPSITGMGSVIYATAGTSLYALDSATGQKAWTFTAPPGTTALETIAAGSW